MAVDQNGVLLKFGTFCTAEDLSVRVLVVAYDGLKEI